MSNQRNLLSRIFQTTEKRRLRSGWRLLLHSLLLLLITLPLEFASLLVSPYLGSMPLDFISPLLSLLGITIATYIARRALDRRSFQSLGFAVDKHSIPDILVGIALTGLMMSFIFALEWSLGWIEITGTAFDQFSTPRVLRHSLEALWLYICVGFSEELLSRGYHLQNLCEGTNMALAVILSSSVFGFLHIANPNATLISTAGIILAGFFLAYGYLRTGQLWLSIGLHIGWNFFEGTVFGFPVSGTTGFNMIKQVDAGPVLFTGGAFGPEAGLVLLPALLLGTATLAFYTRSRPSS